MGREEPLIRVERGRPDEAELAAVVTVLLGLQAEGRETPEESPAAGIRWWHESAGYAAPDGWR